MRRTLLVANAVVVAFFTCLLAYTFLGRAHVAEQCRACAIELTVQLTSPLVDAVDQELSAPAVGDFVPEFLLAQFRRAVVEYRADPASYVQRVVSQVAETPADSDNPIVQRIASINAAIAAYFDESVDALITDLRIFATSNLVAGLIAFLLALVSPDKVRALLVWCSCLMCISILLCAYLYVDDMTFFRILSRGHLGWSYPILLFGSMVRLMDGLARLLDLLDLHAPDPDSRSSVG